MPAHRTSSLSAVGFLVAAGLALTGCSGATSEREEAAESTSSPAPSQSEESPESGGSEQTAAEACAVLGEGLEAIGASLTEDLSGLQSDPAAASAALDEVTRTFSANVDEVTNPGIRDLAVAADEALVGLNDQIAAYAADSSSVDPAALTESVTALQASFGDVGAACT